MAKRSIKAERDYEARGARPGVQISIRWSDDEIAKIDKARGNTPRAEFLKNAVRAALQWREPPAKKAGKGNRK